jgi:hypothetical protein
MGRLSMATRKELTEVAAERYQTSHYAEKTWIFDEFVDITGYHRKHAMRLLRGEARARTGGRRRRRSMMRRNGTRSFSFGRRRTEFAASG